MILISDLLIVRPSLPLVEWLFFLGYIFCLTIAKVEFPGHSFIMVSFVLVFLLGLIDDLFGTRSWIKLLATILIALFIVFPGNLIITNLHGFFSIYKMNLFFSYALTIFVIVFIIHAINLIDGIDGLASGLGITTLSIFSICFYQSGYYQYLMLTLPMIFSLSAFLIFNLWGKRFKIFMGDAGSLLIGLVLAITLIFYMKIPYDYVGGYLRISPVSVFSLLIVPIYDTFHVSAKRILNGQSPFSPDTRHIHHTFLKLGLSHRKSTFVLIMYTIIFFTLGQLLLIDHRAYITLIILIILAFFLWNIPEYIYKNTKKEYALE